MALTDKQKVERFNKQMENQRKNRAKRQLLIEKAVKQGITVSDDEVNEWLARHA